MFWVLFSGKHLSRLVDNSGENGKVEGLDE